MTDEADAGENSRDAVQRSVVIYTGLLLLTVAAAFSAVGILNRELYSASAFVRIYLDAVADHDVAAALATPGVTLVTDDEPGTGEASLITPDALGGLSDVELVSDTEIIPGRHRLVFSYTLTGTPVRGDSNPYTMTAQSEFDVERTGTSWLVFPEWSFVRSPTATATVTVSHASDFTAGSVQVAAGDPTAFHASSSYEMLVPSLVMLSHHSEQLGSRAVPLSATKPRSPVSAIVDVQPTTGFLAEVQSAVDDFLADCVTERLLYPPGCPFGLDVNDRIVSEPVWSIETLPQLTLLAGQDSWVVPNAKGSARVVVDIRSLFDGTVTTRDEIVPFDVSFAVSVEPDGSIVFSPRS
ncbi:hypothetical protein SCB71_20680 [Herbiconiux sp. KACC 21604]|uniref:hypothetical protein n=1 Tax=unclassified Herbiconiux TaxID=2618217 RepID=UPI00149311C0|nr:hypothetical protein [Herbiconiux sp. SALV-R1]QJU55430.1 hypothetical protein HL652_18605 [Herbiconiux sp. SALV-R1]WPO86610.1 hypothetical protein SCB71_20680 [Herbiconiux sp. KACC 21604]